MWIAVRQYHDMVNLFIAIRFSNVEMNGGNGGHGAGHNGGTDDNENCNSLTVSASGASAARAVCSNHYL